MEKQKGILKKITGIIFPTKRDRNGKITGIIIDSVDQDQDGYIVVQNRKGGELIEHVYRKVEIQGIITENDNGEFYINVKSHQLLDKDHEDNRKYG
jgi:hypothetical protein